MWGCLLFVLKTTGARTGSTTNARSKVGHFGTLGQSQWKFLHRAKKKKRRVEIRPSTSRHTLPMAKRLKILGSTYLVGKIKLKLLFHGPLARWGIYIYIYGHTPPPWSTHKHFIWELPVFYAHFFLPEKWHSHVSISFTYYVSRRPRHTHTYAIYFFCYLLLFWAKSTKTSRKPKKPKKTKLQTLTHQLVPT